MKYAIISDIHEDIVCLEKVITHISKQKVHKIVCLGDITGFSDLHHSHKDSKNAEACINLLKEKCDIIVAGNHDLNTLDKLPEYLKRHEEANSFLPKETWAYEGEIHAVLSQENYKFLNKLPEYEIDTTSEYKILFSHFLYPDFTGSTLMIPEIKKELKPHFNFMRNNGCLLSFVGHTHINGYAVSNGRHLHFREFGFKRLLKKEQVVFGPAIVTDGERTGYMLFDSESFELATIKFNT